MKVIDAHAHQYGVFEDINVLRRHFERNPELRWVVLLSDLRGGCWPTPEEVEASNESTLRYLGEIPDRLLGFCYVNPIYSSHAVEEFVRRFEAGMLGLKLWVATRCNDPRNFPVVEAAISRGAPILAHTWHKVTGNLYSESEPTDMADLARRYPEGKFVMAHISGDWEYGIKAIRELPNVRVDFAGSVNERGAYEMAVRELGEDRVIFGTDLPANYLENLGRVLQCGFPGTVQAKILAGNFEAILPRALPT
jgi:predicted TIM-barrel fold metal-dependent hydrolase